MSRNVPFDESAACDNCKAVGAFDFMGDHFCAHCARAGEFLIRPAIRELLCQHCAREYPVWFAPSDLWNEVTAVPDDQETIHFLCLTCFAVLAELKGVVPTAWAVLPEKLQ